MHAKERFFVMLDKNSHEAKLKLFQGRRQAIRCGQKTQKQNKDF